MSRYIDAEWLKKRIHDVPLANGAVHGCVDKLDLNEAPSIDIVRCKECVAYIDGTCDCDSIYAHMSGDLIGVHFEPYEDFYCGFGYEQGE